MTESVLEFVHGKPVDDMTCMSCWDDVSSENYVEYRSSATSTWSPSGFCEMCVGMLLKGQWKKYTESLSTTTCKAEQRRLLERGPPINVSDKTAMPCPDGDHAEVHSLWYMSDGEEHSAKLDGSLEGDARQTYWKNQKEFYILEEPDEEGGADETQAASP
jgi:hypothetical protein